MHMRPMREHHVSSRSFWASPKNVTFWKGKTIPIYLNPLVRYAWVSIYKLLIIIPLFDGLSPPIWKVGCLNQGSLR
jgi:hypothetical protein